MRLTSLDTLKSISGYADIRSVRTWLASLGVPLLKIGRQYAADTEAFEKALAKRYRLKKSQQEYRPTEKAEQAFYDEFNHLLSKNQES